ncbi:L-aminopeptidase/D-esterase-like protein [Streptomyces sp. LBL]|nr:L-aminopeptidase/D-esterase-like protein [Streptomyces sp. LBL]
MSCPAQDVHRAARLRLAEIAAKNAPPPLDTTLAVVATDADLSKAQAQKLAGTTHDGIARAARRVHLLNDGTTVVTVAVAVIQPRGLSFSGIQLARKDTVHGTVTAVRAANPGQSLPRRNAHATAMSPAAIHVEDHAIGARAQ